MKENGNEYYAEVYRYTLKATEKSIANGDAGKSYIGQTYDPKERQRKWNNPNTRYSGHKINDARDKYGVEDWTYEVLARKSYKKESTRTKKIDDLETAMIRKYDSINNGFNISEGRGMKGLKHTPEAREKMSQAKMGHIVTDETRKKISKGIKKYWKKVRRAMTKLMPWNSKSPKDKQKFERFCRDCRQLYERFGQFNVILPPAPRHDNSPLTTNNMYSKIMYLPSGAEYNNRKEAKMKMGHSRFNKALRDGQMLFIKDSDR